MHKSVIIVENIKRNISKNGRRIIEKIRFLEIENEKLKEKLKKRNNRKPIKTTKKEIVDYWETEQEEVGLSVD